MLSIMPLGRAFVYYAQLVVPTLFIDSDILFAGKAK
jgi:hypothetical protein